MGRITSSILIGLCWLATGRASAQTWDDLPPLAEKWPSVWAKVVKDSTPLYDELREKGST